MRVAPVGSRPAERAAEPPALAPKHSPSRLGTSAQLAAKMTSSSACRPAKWTSVIKRESAACPQLRCFHGLTSQRSSACILGPAPPSKQCRPHIKAGVSRGQSADQAAPSIVGWPRGVKARPASHGLGERAAADMTAVIGGRQPGSIVSAGSMSALNVDVPGERYHAG